MLRKTRKMLLLPLMITVLLSSIPTALAAPPAAKTVQAHGQCTEIWVALSWVYIGTYDPNYPFLNHEAVIGPWQVTAQPEADKAEFNAAVKTRVGVVKFELVRVDDVEFDGSTLIVEGAIKEKYRGYSYTWDMEGTKITVNLVDNTMNLDLNNDDNNLDGAVKRGSAHP